MGLAIERYEMGLYRTTNAYEPTNGYYLGLVVINEPHIIIHLFYRSMPNYERIRTYEPDDYLLFG
jgi:hypothetical protein